MPDRVTLMTGPTTTGSVLPPVRWLWSGPVMETAEGGYDGHHDRTAGAAPGTPLLIEHSRPSYARPGLRGHRADGSAWTTRFLMEGDETQPPVGHGSEGAPLDGRRVLRAGDPEARLGLVTEIESLAGGPLRIRHLLTNRGDTDYFLDGLEVSVPLPDHLSEILDFTGRHERERTPQRHPLTDGLWLRESRHGKPGHDHPTLLLAGEQGLRFGAGSAIGVAVATSGNSVLAVERTAGEGASLRGGELLEPGEIVLAPGSSYSMPWVVFVASQEGLDGIAAALHTWQRSLPAHPDVQPVTLNVWEAIYFDQDPEKLGELAERAARVGVERFVLDDGWFHRRRHDHGGLGDWWVDPEVWPDGLRPLADRVHALGMEFGLWIEPEMINADSELFERHPDWILGPAGRSPAEHRHQQVLDLTRPEAWELVRDRIDRVLAESAVDAVKWDHNRDLLEAGSGARAGAAVVHLQTRAFADLLADLRSRHPQIAWESCAGGGGRVDLAVVEQVQRVWTSDMTDALARQQIQRWTAQLLAPEYLGAHVSAPVSHQTGRALTLDFRAATALFGSFGIEWDLTAASEEELAELAVWCARYKEYRGLLHSGRMVRLDVADPAVLAHGVVASSGSRALFAHVQLDESAHTRGVMLRLPGLDRDSAYDLRWVGPVDGPEGLPAGGPTGGSPVPGRVLEQRGMWIPRRRPETILLVDVRRRHDAD